MHKVPSLISSPFPYFFIYIFPSLPVLILLILFPFSLCLISLLPMFPFPSLLPFPIHPFPSTFLLFLPYLFKFIQNCMDLFLPSIPYLSYLLLQLILYWLISSFPTIPSIFFFFLSYLIWKFLPSCLPLAHVSVLFLLSSFSSLNSSIPPFPPYYFYHFLKHFSENYQQSEREKPLPKLIAFQGKKGKQISFFATGKILDNVTQSAKKNVRQPRL